MFRAIWRIDDARHFLLAIDPVQRDGTAVHYKHNEGT